MTTLCSSVTDIIDGDGYLHCTARRNDRNLWLAIRLGIFGETLPGNPNPTLGQLRDAEKDDNLTNGCKTLISAGETMHDLRKRFDDHFGTCDAHLALAREEKPQPPANATYPGTHESLIHAIAGIQT